MKKIIGSLMLGSILTIMGCTDEAPKTEVTKEVIVVPAKPVIVEKAPATKPTTITLDKNGVKVEAKKIDVTIKNP